MASLPLFVIYRFIKTTNMRKLDPHRPPSELQQIVADLIEGVILVGHDKAIHWANAAACRMHGVDDWTQLGRTPADYRRRFRLRYRNHRRVPAASYPIDRVIAGESFSDLLVEVTPRAHGEGHWVHRVRSLVIAPTSAGAQGERVVFFVDVSAWAEAEQRFEQAFKANPAPAVICRLSDLHYIKVNPGFLDMTGYASKDVVGRSIYQLDVLGQARDREVAIRHLSAGEPLVQTQAELEIADGGSKLVIVAGQPINIGEEPCMLFTFADLEPHRQAADALRESEERFAKAFQMTPVPTLLCLADRFDVTEVNQSLMTATGYTAADLLGRSLADIGFIDAATTRAEVASLLQKARALRDVECTVRRKDGATIDCVICAETVHLEGAASFLVTLLDITSRKRNEMELVAAIETVMADASWFSRTLIEKLANVRRGSRADDGIELADLTGRERDVLDLICEGLTDKAIAARLQVSPNTVRNHVAAVYSKLGIHRRGEAIVWARERGFPRREARPTRRGAAQRR